MFKATAEVKKYSSYQTCAPYDSFCITLATNNTLPESRKKFFSDYTVVILSLKCTRSIVFYNQWLHMD